MLASLALSSNQKRGRGGSLPSRERLLVFARLHSTTADERKEERSARALFWRRLREKGGKNLQDCSPILKGERPSPVAHKKEGEREMAFAHNRTGSQKGKKGKGGKEGVLR